MEATALLHEDIALAAVCAPESDVALALAADPFRLDLPPLPAPAVSAEALRALSALYLAARVEETGLPAAAEWLVRERATLRVPPTTGARLEDYARRRTQEYPRHQRTVLYARLFGLGSGTGRDTAGSHARFEPLLGALCAALVACGARRAGAADGPHRTAALTGLDLAQAAGLVYSGGVGVAVTPISEALRRAADLVSDPGIGSLVGTQGLWATLEKLLQPNAPDWRRLLELGRHGQRVLRWLADVAGDLQRPEAVGPEIPAGIVNSAAAWLAAYGLPARDPGEGSV
jgi:hypothetical protein